MTNSESKSGINALKAGAVVVALIAAVAVFILVRANPGASGAEKKVEKELNALKTSEYVGSELSDLRRSLSEEGREDFDDFIEMLKDFDYEITGSTESDDPDDDYTKVNVKITSYDFGREYLAAWTDYIRIHGDSLSSSDITDFYESLFERLSGLEEKEYIRNVEIVCIDPIDNGDWIAAVKDNEDLQDAIFGGMLSEMRLMAAE